MNKKIIVTGGFGFIGSAFVRLLNSFPNIEIVIIDKCTYAADESRVKGCKYKHIKKDICDVVLDDITGADYIVNFAAETHVDNSITNGLPFIKSNIEGVFNLVELSRGIPELKMFIQISTDEVYGDIARGTSFEEDSLLPSSYYSAAKAAADMLVISAGRTYGFPYLITRTCNNFGVDQDKEKFIPKLIDCIKNDKKFPLYGNGDQVREWIWVEDNVTEIWKLMNEGVSGVKNIGSRDRWENIELIQLVSKILNKEVKFKHVADRLGHDRRYALRSDNPITMTIEQFLIDYFSTDGQEN
ncbi:MAG: NAD-dependent epimerase/dehydratase family protein [Ignavibacteriae bacterium]|nr:NAD-dependent epimerase/dehydratase family protein [Ignavibacteriota bacterium]